MKRKIDEEQAEAYLEVAIKFRFPALRAAVERFALGMVPNQELQFGPSTAQLALECRLQETVLNHIERKTPPRAIPTPHEFCKEHRAQMGRRLLDLAVKVEVQIKEHA